jgi:hypothetical protein
MPYNPDNARVLIRLYDYMVKNQEGEWTPYTIANLGRKIKSNWATVNNWFFVLQVLGVIDVKKEYKDVPVRFYRIRYDEMRRFIGIEKKRDDSK